MKSNSNIRDIIEFLQELAANNNRTWFQAHKAQYDALRRPWERDMERLIDLVGEYDDNVRGLNVKNCIYRIYRDVRFSHNKDPYKTYFSGVLGRGGRHTIMSSYYVHFEPDNLMICGGVWWPEKPILDRVRSLIDAEGKEFLSIINNKEIASRYILEGDKLKTMPKGYDASNPMAEYLKMKDYIFTKYPSLDFYDCDDWVSRVAEELKPLKPFHDFMNYVFE